MHITEYKNIISDLRSEIDNLKLKLNEGNIDFNKVDLSNFDISI